MFRGVFGENQPVELCPLLVYDESWAAVAPREGGLDETIPIFNPRQIEGVDGFNLSADCSTVESVAVTRHSRGQLLPPYNSCQHLLGSLHS